VDALSGMVGWQLIRAFRAHHYSAEQALHHLGLHAAQEVVLLHLAHGDGLSQTELAERLEIEPPSMTLMLRKIELAGLVTRCQDAKDGRVMRVFLTERGRDLTAPSLAMWQALEAQMLRGMSEAEQALLRRLLMHITENLDETR